MTKTIKVGACYRDPDDGEIVRALRPAGEYWRCIVLVECRNETSVVGDEAVRVLTDWERVPDPTLAVIDDEPAHAEAERQERIDATARALWSMPDFLDSPEEAYRLADMLEAARERYIAGRKGGAK